MFNFLMKKMLKSQMKGVPEPDQQKILALLEKNPELFKQIAMEVKQKIDSGKEQYAASMEVMKAHEAELKDILKDIK